MRAARVAALLLSLAAVSGCGSSGSSASSGGGRAADASTLSPDASDASASSTAEGADAAVDASPACLMTMASVGDAGGCTASGAPCDASDYLVGCRVPAAPDPALGCQQLPAPTGQHVSLWCCPCGQ